MWCGDLSRCMVVSMAQMTSAADTAETARREVLVLVLEDSSVRGRWW